MKKHLIPQLHKKDPMKNKMNSNNPPQIGIRAMKNKHLY